MNNQPLCNRKIMVTRPVNQSVNLCRLITAAGGMVINFPVIEIVPVVNQLQSNVRPAVLKEADMVIFVSRNAVEFFERLFPDLAGALITRDVMAVGAGTRRELVSKGVPEVTYSDSGTGSEALLQLQQMQAQAVNNKTVVIVRGVGGREYLKDELQARGAEVHYLEVYSREKPGFDPLVLKNIWHASSPDAIVISSAEGLLNLIDMTEPADQNTLFNTPLAVISERIKEIALSREFTLLPQVAAEASDNGLLQALVRIFEE